MRAFSKLCTWGWAAAASLPWSCGNLPRLEKCAVPLTILDTTDPVTIRKVEKRFLADKNLLGSSRSKSWTTAEPLAFAYYFYRRAFSAEGELGRRRIVAISLTPPLRSRGRPGIRATGGSSGISRISGGAIPLSPISG